MKVKIDTKEKFTVIMPEEETFYANMTEEFTALCKEHLNKPIKNIILNLKNVKAIEENAATAIAEVQHFFYEKNASFVLCELQPNAEGVFDKLEILEIMNTTPTESEAWDIVQMEEIERELLDGEDFAFNAD